MLLLATVPVNASGEMIIRFTKPQDVDTELPSRVLLATHAAVAQILHASGMAEYVDKILDDREEIRQLSADGSTDLDRLLPALLVY